MQGSPTGISPLKLSHSSWGTCACNPWSSLAIGLTKRSISDSHSSSVNTSLRVLVRMDPYQSRMVIDSSCHQTRQNKLQITLTVTPNTNTINSCEFLHLSFLCVCVCVGGWMGEEAATHTVLSPHTFQLKLTSLG